MQEANGIGPGPGPTHVGSGPMFTKHSQISANNLKLNSNSRLFQKHVKVHVNHIFLVTFEFFIAIYAICVKMANLCKETTKIQDKYKNTFEHRFEI